MPKKRKYLSFFIGGIVLGAVLLVSMISTLSSYFFTAVEEEESSGGSGSAEEIVRVALGEDGTHGGAKYWNYVFGSGFIDGGATPWCACFVSWCANECGLIEQGVIPKYASCVLGEQWFKERNQWQGKDYTPKAGDIIFFDWNLDGRTDHTGIVQYAEGSNVVTIEGNTSGESDRTGNCVAQCVRARTYIYGYGTPQYPAKMVSGDLSGSDTAEMAYNFLKANGFSHAAAVGIVANFKAESEVNPSCIQGNGRGPAAGVCQWENYNTQSGRWKAMADYAASKGKDWTDYQSQLEYILYELQGGDSTTAAILNRNYGGLEAYKKTTDALWATLAFEKSFERAGKPRMEVRYQYAAEYDQRFR